MKLLNLTDNRKTSLPSQYEECDHLSNTDIKVEKFLTEVLARDSEARREIRKRSRESLARSYQIIQEIDEEGSIILKIAKGFFFSALLLVLMRVFRK